MKITRKKITASTSSLKIPAPFDKYYDIASDAEINEYTGYIPEEGELSPCEDCEGYEAKHLSWVIAKPEYRDALANSGLDAVELISEGRDTMLAYVVGDRIFAVDEEDMADAIGSDKIESSTKIEASAMPKIPAPFDDYYQVMSDEEVEELTGDSAHPSPCEDCEGYDIEHICYLAPKRAYEDELFDSGIGDVELLREGNRVFVGYCVHDRIYSVSESDLPLYKDLASSTAIYSEDDDPGRDAFEDDPVAGIAAMLSISYDDAEDIFDRYDAVGSTADYDDISEFLDFVNDDIRASLEGKNSVIGPMNDSLKESISRGIEGCDQVPIESAVDTGLEYWYYSRHGMGPGTIPQGVQVEDWYEEGYKTWMKLNKMLTTAELNAFELKEQTPPTGVTTHNGDVIEGCSSVNAAECVQVSEDEDSINYVVSDTETDSEPVEASEDFVVDYKIPDDPEFIKKEEQKRIARETADEDDAYDAEHKEGIYAADDDAELDDYLDDDDKFFERRKYNDTDFDEEAAEKVKYDDEYMNISLSDALVTVEPDTSWKLENEELIKAYATDDIPFDRLMEDFEFVFAWAVPSAPGRYEITADVSLLYKAHTDWDGSVYYEFDAKDSKVYPIDTKPAGRDFDEPVDETIEESTNIETSEEPAEVTASMTEAELDDALLNGKPFDLATFKKYKTNAEDDAVTADEVVVGDVIAVTEDASETNLGTVVKILSINDPDRVVDWASYTFHVQLLESPEQYWHNGLDPYRDVELQPGDEMDLHFDADDYVGLRIQTDETSTV